MGYYVDGQNIVPSPDFGDSRDPATPRFVGDASMPRHNRRLDLSQIHTDAEERRMNFYLRIYNHSVSQVRFNMSLRPSELRDPFIDSNHIGFICTVLNPGEDTQHGYGFGTQTE